MLGHVLADRMVIMMTSRTGRRLAHLLELTFGCLQFSRVDVEGGGFLFDMNIRYPRAKGLTTDLFHMVGCGWGTMWRFLCACRSHV
jgi:hypothetical protein